MKVTFLGAAREVTGSCYLLEHGGRAFLVDHGLFLAALAVDVHVHDTYFVVAHFHYIMVGASVMAYLGAVHYWWPKMTGRMMNEFWGKVHFWTSLLFMNLIFQPMFQQGMSGMLRRMSETFYRRTARADHAKGERTS